MRRSITVLLFVLVSVFLVACNGSLQTSQTTSEKQEAQRTSNMDKADAQVPVPQTSNFIARETVAEYMRRMDQPDKLFYIYLLADTGQVLGYHVSRGQPVNICTFMTPPDRVDELYNEPDVVRSAPALDGLYYGSSACNIEYFFDAETDALVQLRDIKMIISDQPLSLNAEPITVKQTE